MNSFRKAALTALLCVACVVFDAVTTDAQNAGDDFTSTLKWRSIGPANMSGRVSDVEGVDSDFRVALIAAASGGVWKTTNAGTTWEPIFDKYGAGSIGDVAFFQKNPDIIWVGTGESNNRNSVAWGNGIFKSTDGGKTFECMGLEDTHQIAKIRTHPDNPDIVYAAAIGHLWGFSGDRGLFKTTDGGKTWKKLTNGLPSHEKIGATDLVINPENPDVLYVAMYQRRRQPFRYDGGSPDGGIYRSTDAGESWTKMTNGLPTGGYGRIGLDIYRGNPDIVVAVVETEQDPDDPLYVSEWGMIGGPTSSTLDKPGSGIYRTEDGGDTWEYINTFNSRPFYFSKIRINPTNDQRVYVLAMDFRISEDGGRTWSKTEGWNIHGDYHAMWLDPQNEDRFYIGNDGGAALTHDHGDHFIFFDNFAIGQFYAVGVDMREPYWVYGGLQDNGTWGGPSNSRDELGILTDHWFQLWGWDGFHAQADPSDWKTVYSESQGAGNLYRTNVETRERVLIRPSEDNVVNYFEFLPDPPPNFYDKGPYRFNWSSPVVMSPHNPHTLYVGANHLFRTIDRGDTWKVISPDLTTNDSSKMLSSGGMNPDNTAAEYHCTIITICESPIVPGLIWVGTDDGKVQVTRNGGATWTDVAKNIRDLPKGRWVSRVETSHHAEGTAYVSVDGHRSDDFTPYLFKTTDYGKTWKKITKGIPGGHSMYVIKEDLKNPNLLFAGSEFDAFASIDGGESWRCITNNMPNVAFHDLVIHPRDGDLIAGTHGRSIWIMDDITPLQQLTDDVLSSDVHFFKPRPAIRWQKVTRGGSRGHFYFAGKNPPSGAGLNFYLKYRPSAKVKLEVTEYKGDNRFETEIEAEEGLNRYYWGMKFDTSEEQRETFRKTVNGWFEQVGEKKLTGSQRKALDKFIDDFRIAASDKELIDVRKQFLKEFSDLVRVIGINTWNLPPFEGPAAAPGTYKVTLTVDGESYTQYLTVRSDPLLESR